MSFLQKQQDAFKSSVQAVAPKIQAKRNLGPPIPASAPSPAPSNASTGSKADTKPDNKRKREAQQSTVFSQPAATGTGVEFSTQVHYALDYLKGKDEPKGLIDILQYLSINPQVQRGLANKIALALKHHPKASYIPDSKSKSWDAGMFQYRPRIPVRTKADLVAYLQSRPDAQGIRVADLKDGFPDVEDAIDALEKEHKILVSRVKKENRAKMVWTNDPTLIHDIDPEFQAMWHKTELPSVDEVVRKLLEAGQKPASEDPSKRVKVVNSNKEKKKRKPRAGGKTTNTHMQHLLKDYSHLKR